MVPKAATKARRLVRMTKCGRLVDVTPPSREGTSGSEELMTLCVLHLCRWQGEVLGGTSKWFVCNNCLKQCDVAAGADRYLQFSGNVNRCVRCARRLRQLPTAALPAPPPELQADLGMPVGVFMDSMGDKDYLGVWSSSDDRDADFPMAYYKLVGDEDFRDSLLGLGSLQDWHCVRRWRDPDAWTFQRKDTPDTAGTLFAVMHEPEGLHLFSLPCSRFWCLQDAEETYDINHIGFDSFHVWLHAQLMDHQLE